MHWIDWCIAIIPLIAILGLAVYSGRYIRGVVDFLAAGRVAGRYVISVGDMASGLSVMLLVAMCEQKYQIGYGIDFWAKIIVPAGIIFSLTGYCTYRWRETKALSFGQFLEMRYNRPFRIFAAALRTAAAELATQKGQKGYGPAAGYPFLREAIAAQYADLPCPIPPEEVTVTAGSKEALGALFSLWEPGVPVWVCDPVYPAYRAQAEAAGHPVFPLPCRAENDFLPQPEEVTKPGLIVLCTPNNPTGAALSLVEMTEWVNWANRTGSLLLVDTAYAAFLSGEELPRSIYAVPGAKRCAIEVGSFSKSDGFTGVRCGWVILPRETGCAAAWQRWLGSHSNGTSYPIQRAAEAALSPTGLRQRQRALALYRQNAATMLQMFHKLGLTCAARRPGCLAPYLWVRCPDGPDAENSWAWFHRLLEGCGVLCAPGAGFGQMGEGWLRFTAFSRPEDTAEALRRMEHFLR